MAAYPNSKRPPAVTGRALVRRAEALRVEVAAAPAVAAPAAAAPAVAAPAAAAPAVAADIAPDTAWRLLYQELFDFALDAHVLTDAAGIICAVNHAATDLLHVRKDFMLDKPLSFFIARCDWGLYYNWLLRICAGQADALLDRALHVQPPRGAMRSMMVHVARCADSAGSGRVLRWQMRPLTDHEELKLRAAVRAPLHRLCARNRAVLVLVLNAHGGIQRAGAAVCTLLGIADRELHGRDWRSLFPRRHHPALQHTMVQALAAQTPQRVIAPLELPDGRQRSVSWGIKSLALEPTSPVILLAVGHDITELEQAQQQALQAERLAAIGQVTAALAHEARNMLQRIQGGLDRLSWRLQDRPEALDILTRVQAAQRDMTYLFDNVRSYAAPLKFDVASCDIAEICREAWQHVLAAAPGKRAELIEATGGVNPRLHRRWFPHRTGLPQYPGERAGGRPRAGPRDRDVPRQCHRSTAGADDRLPRQRPRPDARAAREIFEPFYTTKPRGTGLGMAIAKRIVEAHGGTIAVGAQTASPLPRSPRGSGVSETPLPAGQRGRGDGEPGGAEILVTLPRRTSE